MLRNLILIDEFQEHAEISPSLYYTLVHTILKFPKKSLTERVEESVLQLVRLVFCARLVSRGCLLVSTAITT